MSSPPRVWFLLMDSATGQPYKGTSADKVHVSPSADVADFRKKVKEEYADSHLNGIVASQLRVFKNKSSFDKRNAAVVDEGKEEPLEEDTLMDGLGETEEEALVVVVPSSVQPSQIEPSPFRLCRVPFFNSICNAMESDDGWISFGQTIPSTSLNHLFIRECYRTIASSINPGINKALIAGTAGIGKSLLLVYLLWKLVKEGKRVLFIYHPFTIYYDGKGGVFQVVSRHGPLLCSDYSFWNDTLWCLFDAKGKKGALDDFPYELCTFVVSTSPQREMALVRDFKKPPVPQVFHMPTWTEAELEAIAPLFPNAKYQWRYRFKILGGIPRYVLEVTTQTPEEVLEETRTDY